MSNLLEDLVPLVLIGLFFMFTVGGWIYNIVMMVWAIRADDAGMAIIHLIGVPFFPLGILLGDLGIVGLI